MIGPTTNLPAPTCPCGAELPPGWRVCAGCFIRNWR